MKKSYQNTSTSTNNHNNQFVQEIIHTITRHFLFILWSMSSAGALIGIPIGLLNPRTNHQPEVLRTAYFSPCFAMSMQFCSLFRNASPVFHHFVLFVHRASWFASCSPVFLSFFPFGTWVKTVYSNECSPQKMKAFVIHHQVDHHWSSLIIKYH